MRPLFIYRRHGITPATFVPELESCRGIAALVVFFSHILLSTNPAMTYRVSDTPGLGFPPLLRFTNSYAAGAVIVFFVMSGYVMNLMWSRGPLIYSFYEFILRRAIRLIPLMLVSILITYTANLLVDYTLTSFRGPVVVDWVRLWDNLLIYKININGVLWSLKVELYACVILPIYLIVRDRSRLLGFMIAVTCVIGPYYCTPGDQNLIVFNFYLFIIGAEIGYLDTQDEINRARNATILIVSLAMLPSLCVLEYTSGLNELGIAKFLFLQHSLHILQGLSAFFIVAIMAGVMGTKPWCRFLNWFSIRQLGKISYSLYLIHPTILILVSGAVTYLFGVGLNDDSISFCLLITIIIFLTSIMAAITIHKIFEIPSITFSRRFVDAASKKRLKVLVSTHGLA